MRYTGKLTSWKDDQGFGFVTPNDGSAAVFLHIKALASDASRPSEGDLISYELTFDERKRPRAKAARRVGEKIQKTPDGRGWKAPVFSLVFCLFVLSCWVAGQLPVQILAIYVALSVVAFIAYGLDKAAAQAGRWRTAEATLHLFGLAGGWPGALWAQRLLRHKSVKQEFQTVFWITVLVNCGILAWFLTAGGRAFLNSVLA